MNSMLTNSDNKKEKLRICRHFSYRLISAAMNMSAVNGGDGVWEEQEVIEIVELND